MTRRGQRLPVSSCKPHPGGLTISSTGEMRAPNIGSCPPRAAPRTAGPDEATWHVHVPAEWVYSCRVSYIKSRTPTPQASYHTPRKRWTWSPRRGTSPPLGRTSGLPSMIQGSDH